MAVQPAFGGKSCQHPLEDMGSEMEEIRVVILLGRVDWHVCELKCWSNIVMEDDMLVFIDVTHTTCSMHLYV